MAEKRIFFEENIALSVKDKEVANILATSLSLIIYNFIINSVYPTDLRRPGFQEHPHLFLFPFQSKEEGLQFL